MQNILYDLRYALRQLRRAPVFALTAILTLALGVGANTAIFSLLDQALLRSLPVRNPRQLVYLQGTGDAWQGHSSNHGGGIDSYFSYPMYRDLRDKDTAFESALATAPASVDLTRGSASEIAEAELVSGNYFDMLGIRPALGRLFTQAEDQQKDAAPVIVLSYDYWRVHIDSDPSVVNETISLNGHPFKVIGIAAPGFRSAVWGETPALFVPMAMIDQVIPGQGRRLTDHTDRWLNIIARLKDGVSITQAEAVSAPLWHALRADELKALGNRSKRFTDEFLTNSRLKLQPAARGFSYNRESFETPLLVVMAMAILVLLIASVNVASLLLVRSAARIREFSLRYALGAKATRILQQPLLEGLLIGIGGGLAGMLLAPFAIRVLVRRLSEADGSGPFVPSMDARLLLFNFAIAIAVSVFFSLAPAFQALRPDRTGALRTQLSTATSGALGFRRFVVGAQIGLSLLLLVGAGLFVRTMHQLRSFNVGFSTDHLVTFALAPRLAGYDATRIAALQRRVLDDVAATAGVESSGAANSPELGRQGHSGSATFANYHPAPDEDINLDKTNVSPSFFSTLRTPLVAGRAFSPQDNADHPKVAIVNETLAKRYFGSAQNAIGQRFDDTSPSKPVFDTEIVGVVGDFQHEDIHDAVKPTLFRPLDQATGADINRAIYFYARTHVPPATMFASIRRSIASVDPLLAIDDLRTMDDQIELDLENERLITLLAVAFGALATVLAGIGLYGVVAYSTGQRTREIGIRMALGSSRWAVSQLVFGDVFRLAALGIVVAIPIAILLGRLLRSQLFGVSPTDPITLLAAVFTIAAVAIAATLLPARRAAAIQPAEVLRSE